VNNTLLWQFHAVYILVPETARPPSPTEYVGTKYFFPQSDGASERASGAACAWIMRPNVTAIEMIVETTAAIIIEDLRFTIIKRLSSISVYDKLG
jgi:hypothetical protein